MFLGTITSGSLQLLICGLINILKVRKKRK